MGYRAQPNGITRSNGKKMYHQGKYELINSDKYLGDPTNIWYRSGWEQKLYRWADVSEDILKWNVEGTTIPYEMEENGNWKTHRYYPDIYCEIKKPNGTTTKALIEIKPSAELAPPIMPKKLTGKSLENHEYRLRTYLKNINKWTAAKDFCERRGIEFVLLTEKHFENTDIKIF
jgi:hypothetical protein